MIFQSAHRKTCLAKQQERRDRISSLPPVYHSPLTPKESSIISTSILDLVSQVHSEALKPLTILHAFGKKALKAHEKTNCLTEVLIADAESWTPNTKGPLAGIPVSLKDSCSVKGYDSCIGYSGFANQPMEADSPLVRLLKDAGAVPFVKTATPITLMSFESASDLCGACKNPHNALFTSGGSTGGESALLAYGGSLVGIGTDIAGSVRVPAHFAGIYSIKSSIGRFPKPGPRTSMPGQEGIPSITAPMTRTLEDLETFWKAVVSMKPWTYDHTCHPIPWREITLPKRVKWGVLWDDGIVQPSPACRRALLLTIEALRARGHVVIDLIDWKFTSSLAPSPYEGIQNASQLILADGGETMMSHFQRFEKNDAGVTSLLRIFNLPRFIKKVYAFFLRHSPFKAFRDPVTAGFIENLHKKTVAETWKLAVKREGYKAKWFDAWNASGVDFVLTVPNACPAIKHGGMGTSFASVGYTFLFNILDYSAGVLPVIKVDPVKDALPEDFKPRNLLEKGAYKQYNAVEMANLPVGVQVVGRRLEEEKVLEGMKLVKKALADQGVVYKQL